MNSLFKRIKDLYNEHKKLQEDTSEIKWAAYFHEYTKGLQLVQDLRLSPGGWSANYSMLYLISKILIECRPAFILEFGLGESTKLVSRLISTMDEIEKHIIIEDSVEWKTHFNRQFLLDKKSNISLCPIEELCYKEINTHAYVLPEDIVGEDFEFYIVDGPKGSKRFSRINICHIAEKFTKEKEFIILIDDASRKGERETIDELKKIFNKNQLTYFTGIYKGEKTQQIFASNKYKFCSSH